MRVLALVPSFYGYTGDAVNERQLLTALSRKVEKMYVITFVSARQVFTKRRDLRLNLPKNIVIIPLPNLAKIFVAYIAIIGLVSSLLKKVDLIYIRGSFLSMGFLTFRPLAEKTVVKIPAIVEDEYIDGLKKRIIGKLADIFDRLEALKPYRDKLKYQVYLKPIFQDK